MAAPAKDPWFPFVKRNPRAVTRLFCFHYAGGGASAFRGWQALIPPEIEVWPIQLPGHESRFAEPLLKSMDAIVERAETALLPHLNGDFVFFGHSMGARLAFDLTHRLSARGLKPRQLALSANHAPHMPDSMPPIHQLPDEQFKTELRKYNGTPAAFFENPELTELLLPIVRADFGVCETYLHRERPPLDVPIIALGGMSDGQVSKEQLTGWERHTSAEFTLRLFPGDHFYWSQDPTPLLRFLLPKFLEAPKPAVSRSAV